MAITRRFQAQAIVSPHEHSKLVTMQGVLLKQHIEILSATPLPDGRVTVVFCGRGLGEWAVPVPPACDLKIMEDKLHVMQSAITPIASERIGPRQPRP